MAWEGERGGVFRPSYRWPHSRSPKKKKIGSKKLVILNWLKKWGGSRFGGAHELATICVFGFCWSKPPLVKPSRGNKYLSRPFTLLLSSASCPILHHAYHYISHALTPTSSIMSESRPAKRSRQGGEDESGKSLRIWMSLLVVLIASPVFRRVILCTSLINYR